MTAMASNDIIIKRLTCRCVTPFTVKRYVDDKFVTYDFTVDEVIMYELHGTKTVKDGLYSLVNKDGTNITIKGNISELPNFTTEIK